MKRFTSVISMILLLCSLTACSRPVEVKRRDVENPLNDVQMIQNDGYFAEDPSSVYFTNVKKKRVQIFDKTENKAKKFCKSLASNLSLSKDYVFFTDEENKVIRANKEDGEKVELGGLMARKLMVKDEVLYYISMEDYLFKADLDGKNSEKLVEENLNMFLFMDDELYYKSAFGAICTVKDGERVEYLQDESINWFCVYDNSIYYLTDSALFMQYNIADSSTKRIELHMVLPTQIIYHKGELYYRDVGRNNELFVYNLKSGNETRVGQENFEADLYVSETNLVHLNKKNKWDFKDSFEK